MQTVNPTGQQLKAFAHLDHEGAVVMLNLLRYREQADYSGHPEQEPCSGRAAFRRYANLSIACIERVGGSVLFVGKTLATVIGPVDEQWDDVFMVRYPSRQAFFDVIGSDEYLAFAFHRTAALADSRLIALRAKTDA